jgi:hypothetical protein
MLIVNVKQKQTVHANQVSVFIFIHLRCNKYRWNEICCGSIISYCTICARDNLLWSAANFLLSLNWNTIETCLCYYSKGQLCATCLMSNQFCQYITKVLYYGPNIYYSGLSTSCKKSDRWWPVARLLFPNPNYCCLFFFDIRILIAPLVSANSSYFIFSYGNKTFANWSILKSPFNYMIYCLKTCSCHW